MIHPDTELRFVSPTMGFGVFATRLIPCGTLTWVRDELDRVIDARAIRALKPPFRDLLDRYTFRDTGGRHILCWDLGRYMNHSCTPTCLGLGADFEVAVRDILPGEELTDDYATLHLQEHEGFSCCCAARECRGYVGPADLLTRQEAWRALFEPAMTRVAEVRQPLATLFAELSAAGGK
jgi:SET domain-containing protein